MTAINYSKMGWGIPATVLLYLCSMALVWKLMSVDTVVMEPAFIVADQCVVDE
jgi:hypothetical protein